MFTVNEATMICAAILDLLVEWYKPKGTFNVDALVNAPPTEFKASASNVITCQQIIKKCSKPPA